MTKKPVKPSAPRPATTSKQPKTADKPAASYAPRRSGREQPQSRPPANRRPPRRQGEEDAKREVKYYGVHACLELIRKRRDATIRAYVTEAQLPQFKKYLQWCAETRRAYHVVSNDELEAITQSVHHEGVCILTAELLAIEEREFLTKHAPASEEAAVPLLYLAGTANPHNVGAIMRTAAHFGVRYILCERSHLPRIGGALARISKGGCEHVQLVACQDPISSLQALRRKGYQIVTTSSHGGDALYDFVWPAKMVLVLGHETRGVAAQTAKAADMSLVIPGSGEVESLNVSVACAVILSEWYRFRR